LPLLEQLLEGLLVDVVLELLLVDPDRENLVDAFDVDRVGERGGSFAITATATGPASSFAAAMSSSVIGRSSPRRYSATMRTLTDTPPGRR
jgi:hypothetical protein